MARSIAARLAALRRALPPAAPIPAAGDPEPLIVNLQYLNDAELDEAISILEDETGLSNSDLVNIDDETRKCGRRKPWNPRILELVNLSLERAAMNGEEIIQ